MKKQPIPARKSFWALLIGLLILAVVFPLGTVLARYYQETAHPGGIVTSDPFYFTIDKLGDTDTEGSWILSGGTTQTVDFAVTNFYDKWRKNSDQTVYQIELQVTGNDGVLEQPYLTYRGSAEKPAQNTNLTLAGGEQEVYTLTVPEGYRNGAEVTVTVRSYEPYEKTLTLHFYLNSYEHAVAWRVVDAPGSSFVSIYLKANVDDIDPPALKLNWDAINTPELVRWEVDLGNSYLLVDDHGDPSTVNEAVEGVNAERANDTQIFLHEVTITQTLLHNNEIRIDIIKHDKDENYLDLLSEVSGGAVLVDGVYVITFTLKPTTP